MEFLRNTGPRHRLQRVAVRELPLRLSQQLGQIDSVPRPDEPLGELDHRRIDTGNLVHDDNARTAAANKERSADAVVFKSRRFVLV